MNLLDFIITKYLKEVDDDLSLCVDECGPWNYKDLSMSHYQMLMMSLLSMEKCLMDFYQGVVFTGQV